MFNTLSITEPRGRYVETYRPDLQDRVTSVTNIEGQVMGINYLVGDMVGTVSPASRVRLSRTGTTKRDA